MTTVIESDGTLGNPDFVNPTKTQKWESDWIACVANADGSVPIPNTAFDGAKPDKVWFELRIDTAVAGYSVGDIIMAQELVWDRAGSPVAIVSYGVAISLNPTNTEFYYSFGIDGIQVIKKTAGTGNSIQGNSSMKICAERTVIGDVPDITTVGLVPLRDYSINSGDATLEILWGQYENEYDSFILQWQDVRSVVNGQEFQMRITQDQGSTFNSGTNLYATNRDLNTEGVLAADRLIDTKFRLMGAAGSGVSTGESLSNHLEIVKPFTTSGYKVMLEQYGGRNNSSDFFNGNSSLVFLGNEDPIHGAQFFPSSGNLDTGIATLYGYRKVA